ncbi:N-acetylglucosamine-6-phosphate deacetylase [Vibrio sp. ZSDE26]|uniref:N-acetylglucosamine-6-phosphate deacetylase n=1 Tax=Vibrio amylolyticus TaxID=2847292 RepID=A0A9X1XK03_9VIBR|nr:N-acetylglucosamine-6-phosphate deacetylase [Vibrio amylolyticus]MCK6264284.1 N-acetylglucosamine-6-phosphate deacetylase [Vibrio amylolyticus]
MKKGALNTLQQANAKKYAIKNARLFLKGEIADNQIILIEGDTIVAIGEVTAFSELPEIVIDAQHHLISPGFIDLQLNGCGGVLFNTDISLQTLDIMNTTNVKYGTTQFLPTLITSKVDHMTQAIDLVSKLGSAEKLGVLGLHLEGPFISVERKGAHQQQYIRELDINTAHYLSDNQQYIKILTIAPEKIDQQVLDIVAKSSITVSMGHTDASYDQLVSKKGIEMATHLYNAMSPLTNREPGAVGYVFNQKPYAGIIADGIHVDYTSLQIARELLEEKLFLVTDAVTPAGTDLACYNMAGLQAFVTNGKCHYEDGTIAGAAITMSQSIRNLVTHARVPLLEALNMATIYPAKAIGVDDCYGKLEKGYKANLVFLDDELKVTKTIQMGEQVYQS